MAELKVKSQLIGVRELQTILRNTDKKLLRQTQAQMRQAASPMVAQARSITPSTSPLSGWAHKGRTGWREADVQGGLSAKVGGSRISATSWPLLSLRQKNPAGMIYDWAGRVNKGKRPLPHFVNLLPKLGSIKGSQYSRVLFPAFVATRAEVTRAMIDAVETVARQVNVEIERI